MIKYGTVLVGMHELYTPLRVRLRRLSRAPVATANGDGSADSRRRPEHNAEHARAHAGINDMTLTVRAVPVLCTSCRKCASLYLRTVAPID